ncbi:hypothetical protein CKAH01_05475 [Colletotrichum kahawae]|uniref:Uncharacterized protein n=1 Tax=Colletotrichum kahawae TaxID=34407 RepID=A0AAE0D6H5_COLKA|nr:hypothetical protein CKAH01_05475 [Colletotrichum kahawae]
MFLGLWRDGDLAARRIGGDEVRDKTTGVQGTREEEAATKGAVWEPGCEGSTYLEAVSCTYALTGSKVRTRHARSAERERRKPHRQLRPSPFQTNSFFGNRRPPIRADRTLDLETGGGQLPRPSPKAAVAATQIPLIPSQKRYVTLRRNIASPHWPKNVFSDDSPRESFCLWLSSSARPPADR